MDCHSNFKNVLNGAPIIEEFS